MHKPSDFFISRRSLLKAGALSATLLALPAWSTKVIAQATGVVSSQVGSPKPSGLISFNAGWMIPAEDQKALLALEEKKKKEAQPVTQPTAADPVASAEATKPVKKSWGDKLQDTWKKVTNFF